ncbi:MAG: hypothetical protein M0Z67_18325 [Nitrospiraceae bacterium]|nr:hypothetical protein [Nitrospiraceae bacterium]
MKETGPSPIEMKTLYRAASEFRKLAPWEWMDDSDVFGVQDPRTAEIGYCCILGALEEVFALVAYIGADGLKVHLNMQNGKIELDDPDAMFMQDCLMASFENKENMDKDDIRLIKRLNLNFRGRHAWPMFQRYKPGYFPWHLDLGEVLFMTDALVQAAEVCRRLLENDALHTPTNEGVYLVRVPQLEDGKVVWKDEWRKPQSVKETSFSVAHVNELHIQQLKKEAKRTAAEWEIDFFYAPTPISEGKKPYYPYAIMIADHDTGFIYDVYLSRLEGHKKEFMEHFLSCIENTKQIPKEIMVRKEEAARFFETCAASLQIELRVVKRLDAVDSARRSMTRHLQS